MIRENIGATWPSEMFGKGCIEKAKAISGEYQKIAKKHRCHFLDMEGLAEVSEVDSVHMDTVNHERFAVAVHKKITEILKSTTPP